MDTSPPAPDTLRLRSLRDFRLLYAAGLLAGLSAQLTAIALPLLVLSVTGSPAQAGAVATVGGIAVLISMLPGGALADSTERRRLLMAAQSASLVLAAALGTAVLLDAPVVPLAIAVAVSAAVITSVVGPASLGLLRAAVPRELLPLAATRFQARAAMVRVAGPLAGGALYAVHPALPFLAEAAGLTVALLCLAVLRTRSRPARGAASAAFSRSGITAGLAFLWRHRFLRAVLLLFGCGMNAGFAAMMFVVLAVASGNGSSGMGGGSVVALAACGTLAGALLAPRITLSGWSRLPIAGSCWLAAALAATLTLVQQPLLMGVAIGLVTCATGVASVKFATALLMATPERLIGRVQNGFGLVSSATMPLGPLTGGLLLAAAGPAASFALLTGLFVLCAAVATWAPAMSDPPGPADLSGPAGAAPASASAAPPATDPPATDPVPTDPVPTTAQETADAGPPDPPAVLPR
jgi:MFS family permease